MWPQIQRLVATIQPDFHDRLKAPEAKREMTTDISTVMFTSMLGKIVLS